MDDMRCLSLLKLSSMFIAMIFVLITGSYGDTPANCTFEDIKGTWTFKVGAPEKEPSDNRNCVSFEGAHEVKIVLTYPDVATDEFGNKGFWTIIYNQGFEVTVGGRKYFGFSVYKDNASICSQVAPGWSHDVLGHDWACFMGQKSQSVIKHNERIDGSILRFKPKELTTEELVASINRVQNSWEATHYSRFEGMNNEDLIRMAGGRKSHVVSRPTPAPVTEEQKRLRENLPKNFDWRSIDNQDFVSPVRNQEQCGSCYAFASAAMAESRVRILTNNTQKPVFAPQDVVECSVYSQGCDGGFPYLIGGKYAEDFGFVYEECNPYTGKDSKTCHTKADCTRHYMTDYKYVGGYYGGCNEVAMMEAVYNRGPVAVGFEVYKDFMQYKSGVYHHVFKQSLLGSADHQFGKFEPFELTNHAVLVVGWGENETDKWWIVKNSWSTGWGLQGYFLIRRGNDECGIESMAVEAVPVFQFE